jgi:hypothetical protein
MATGNHTISLVGGTKLPQTHRFNQIWKWYQTLSTDQKRRLGILAVFALSELRDAAEQRLMRAGDDDEEN